VKLIFADLAIELSPEPTAKSIADDLTIVTGFFSFVTTIPDWIILAYPADLADCNFGNSLEIVPDKLPDSSVVTPPSDVLPKEILASLDIKGCHLKAKNFE